MTAPENASGHDQERIDNDIIVCDDDAEILDENDPLVADGGTRRRTPVDDLASSDDPAARLENLDPVFAKTGFSIEAGPVVINSAPHGADIEPSARPDPVVIETLGDGEIFAGVQFDNGQMTGDGGFILDENEALQLARALVLAVDADQPVSWGL